MPNKNSSRTILQHRMLEYLLLSITVTFVVADGPLTSINLAHALSLHLLPLSGTHCLAVFVFVNL